MYCIEVCVCVCVCVSVSVWLEEQKQNGARRPLHGQRQTTNKMADQRGLQNGRSKGCTQVQYCGSPNVSLTGENKETMVVLTPYAH